jgi:hypothetical protein
VGAEEAEAAVAVEAAEAEAELEEAERAEVEVGPAEVEAGRPQQAEVAPEVELRPSSLARSSRPQEAPVREVACL